MSLLPMSLALVGLVLLVSGNNAMAALLLLASALSLSGLIRRSENIGWYALQLLVLVMSMTSAVFVMWHEPTMFFDGTCCFSHEFMIADKQEIFWRIVVYLAALAYGMNERYHWNLRIKQWATLILKHP